MSVLCVEGVGGTSGASARILYDARQQPVVMATVPDLKGLLGDGGGALLVLPQGVELCGDTQEVGTTSV